MPSHAAARRRAPAHQRTRTAPRHARRISGPTHAVALPAGRAGSGRGTTGVFERIRALPDSRVVDRILRGRACIWIIGLLLGGIVAMQVSLLKLNSSISTSIELSGTLERSNSDLEMQIAQLSSGDRIESAAAKEGMVAPPAGDVSFLHSRPQDIGLALKRMTSPSDEAQQLMANGGYTTAPLVAATTTATTVTPTAVATPAPTVAPAAVVTPAPTASAPPAPTPTPTPQPVATQVPGATTAPTG